MEGHALPHVWGAAEDHVRGHVVSGIEWTILAVEMVVLPPFFWWLVGSLLAFMGFPDDIDWSGPWTAPPPFEVVIAVDPSASGEVAQAVAVPVDEFGSAWAKVGKVLATSVSDVSAFRLGFAALALPGVRHSIEFGVAVEQYQLLARSIGVDQERADEILVGEMSWLAQSWDPKADWRDAIARARHAVIVEAHRQV
jgi:hypothetical protein